MTVYDLLNKYQMTVTTAESCTGGGELWTGGHCRNFCFL